MMTFTESIKTCFKKCATFEGRASRSEFWWFFLFCLMLTLSAGVADTWFTDVNYHDNREFGPVGIAVALAMLLPQLSVTVRRLHDIDASGWWVLLHIHIFGTVFLAFLHCFKGTKKANRFGSPPAA